MRILSWNINGVRTLPQYHPWNTFKSFEDILNELEAEIICFQEMKSSRVALPRDVALPGPFHSFFSFPVKKGGYSGVAVYTDSRKVVPLKAEEGLSGVLQPKPPLSPEERVSPSYPRAHDIDAYPDEHGDVPSNFEALDGEGRAVVVDFGLFVLINVYCPNETDDTRTSFKMNYHLMLQERVRKLIEEEHREVIVLGDVNICASPIEHAEGNQPSFLSAFYEHPARLWFKQWLDPVGPMVDVLRKFWPQRKGMFTCWNMKIMARESNYGSRVDYILATKGILPWIKHGDTLPSIKGSDHCPLYIDLHEEITLDSGETVKLRDAMKQNNLSREPPRIAAKFWEEFSGKQTVLSAFFGKKREAPLEKTKISPSPKPSLSLPTPVQVTKPEEDEPSSQEAGPSLSSPRASPTKPSDARPSLSTTTKRKSSGKAPKATPPPKKAKADPGQASIAAFFSKPSTSKASSAEDAIDLDLDLDADTAAPSGAPTLLSQFQSAADQEDADFRLACELSASQTALLAQSEPAAAASQSKAAWSSLFAPPDPPRCAVHGEPAKLFTVNKPGPNKGKTFYVCARPVGPGYDRGRAERPRDEVDHQYRCNYFKWASDVKRDSMRERSIKQKIKSGPS
ncbi:DNase I-like protein [Obba rivulosa]|uniref:DNA-(apurinic or apyrimidinic site) endonuclease 2 n=1 Tax=Obba rivulosa TaxID=1052685 RepID=A0A8E2DVG5_9APHY|nr:DNase I-like protein [Obba rivulosa]